MLLQGLIQEFCEGSLFCMRVVCLYREVDLPNWFSLIFIKTKKNLRKVSILNMKNQHFECKGCLLNPLCMSNCQLKTVLFGKEFI